MALAERLQSPVTNTLLGKGAFPEQHPLSLGMLGMHGTAYANYATTRCDLVLSIGSRFDDRINGKTDAFCPLAKKLHIDIDRAEIGKIVTPDAAVCADAKLALLELLPLVDPLDTSAWLDELQTYREAHPLKAQKAGDGLAAARVIEAFYEAAPRDAIVVTDVGQHQMWAAQFFLTAQGRSFLSSGGAGTMGFGLPAAIGAQLARPDALVIACVGDGGFQMVLGELATAAQRKLKVKLLVIDNRCLGMVRQWQELFYDNRLSGVVLDSNPDFVALARAYGIKGFYVDAEADLDATVRAALAYDDGPCLIHASVAREDNVFPMIPAGCSAAEIVLERPAAPLPPPPGST
jgi:acetolactate synthase-1/2/3 large subunit